MENKRYIWIDNVKIIAVILVVLGHLIQSLYKSSLIENGFVYTAFNQIIYSFHVPLFFICSGFLYQQTTKTQNIKSYAKGISKRIVAYGIPFVVFSTITYILKIIFSDSVNQQNSHNFVKSLLFEPIAPYWFLLTLIIMFLLSPIIKSKTDGIIRTVVCIGLYLICSFNILANLPFELKYNTISLCSNMIWFVLGMNISYFKIEKYFNKKGGLLFVAFLIFKTLLLYFKIDNEIINLILSLTACFGMFFFIGGCFKDNRQNKILGFLSKYTMPIFLMHTIFAAGCRAILIKFGIVSLLPHLIAGLIASFVFPIIAAAIMEKVRLDFLYRPTKYIKFK